VSGVVDVEEGAGAAQLSSARPSWSQLLAAHRIPWPVAARVTDSFEQLASIAIDPHHFKEDLFFDKFFHFL